MADAEQSNLTTLTVDLLSAYVANNNVEHSAIPDLIKSTHAALKVIDAPDLPAPEEPGYKPAVSIRQSLKSPDKIVSLIDGKPYQTLKRHLKGHDLTPAQYRERYGLPKDYPMVAPAYSEARREIAKKLGLGNRLKSARNQAASPATTAEVSAPQKSPTPVTKKAAAPKAAKLALATIAKAEPAKAPTKASAKPKPASPAKAGAKAPAAEDAAATAPAKLAPKARRASPAKADAAQSPAAVATLTSRRRSPKAAPAAS
jgi:predicted transcriptional regulator